MLVAAHPSDLAAAQQAGLRTAYILRPDECGPSGPGGPMEAVGHTVLNTVASDLGDLATQLGIA